MYQIPTSIRNDIVEKVKLLNPSMEKLFSMEEEEFQEAMTEQADLLEERGLSIQVVILYQKIAPLLKESTALSLYIDKTQRFDLRTAMPEILSVDEAIVFARGENHLLSEDDIDQLRIQLEKDEILCL